MLKKVWNLGLVLITSIRFLLNWLILYTYEYFVFGLLELVLLADAFEHSSAGDEVSILNFKLALLIHCFGNLFTILLAHLIAHIRFELIQKAKLFHGLNYSKKVIRNHFAPPTARQTQSLTSSSTTETLYASSADILACSIFLFF